MSSVVLITATAWFRSAGRHGAYLSLLTFEAVLDLVDPRNDPAIAPSRGEARNFVASRESSLLDEAADQRFPETDTALDLSGPGAAKRTGCYRFRYYQDLLGKLLREIGCQFSMPCEYSIPGFAYTGRDD